MFEQIRKEKGTKLEQIRKVYADCSVEKARLEMELEDLRTKAKQLSADAEAEAERGFVEG